jgi:hypothetical protein
MDHSEYAARIAEMTEPSYLEGWRKLAGDLRTEANNVRPIDPAMTFLEQGLAVQIDRLVSHVVKRRAELKRAEEILKNAEPVDSEIEITVEEEEQI